MKMLFPPCERSQVNQVRKKLSAAGIRCQIHHNPVAQGVFGIRPLPALLLGVEQGIGFARRPVRTSVIDSWTDITNGTRFFGEDDSPAGPQKLDRDIKSCSQKVRKLKKAA